MYNNGYRDGKGVLRKPLIGKSIAFAVTKRHAETLAQMFDDVFMDQKASPEVRYADYVVSGMGKDDTVDGMSKIKRFKKEAFPKILRLGQHAGHRLRLPRGGQPDIRPLYEIVHSLPTNARARYAEVSGQARLHDVRFRGRLRLSRGRR